MNTSTPQKTSATARSAIVILGMHRSGTSALAGILNILGCDLPATPMSANAYNEKGYFESNVIRTLNDECLKSAGSSWHDWLALNPGWYQSPKFDAFQSRCQDALVREFGISPLFVLKDPRICRLMPLWTQVLAEAQVAPAYVLTHRNPLDVAASLHARDNLPVELGVLIWLRHVLEAEAGTRGERRVFSSYDQILDNWAGVVRKLEDGVDLRFPHDLMAASEEVETFLSSDLRHHLSAKSKVLENPLIAEWVQTTFGIMEAWVETGEQVDDFAELDRVRAEFDAAAPVFAKLISAGTAARGSVQKLSSQVEVLAKSEDDLQHKLESAEAQRAALQAEHLAEVESLIQVRKSLNAKSRRLTEALETAERAAVQQTTVIADTQAELDQVLKTRGDLEAQVVQLSDALKRAEKDLQEQTEKAAEGLAEISRLHAVQQASEQQVQMLTEVGDEAKRQTAVQEALANERAAELERVQDQFTQLQSELRQRQHEANEVGKENAELKKLSDDLEDRLNTALGNLEEAEGTLSQRILELQQAEETVTEAEARAQMQSDELVTLSRLQLESEKTLDAMKTAHAEDMERVQAERQQEREQHLALLAEKSKEFALMGDRAEAQLHEVTELSRILALSEKQVAQLEEGVTQTKDQHAQQLASERARAARDLAALENTFTQKQDLQAQYFQTQVEKFELEKQQLEDQEATRLIQLEAEQNRVQDLSAQLEAERARAEVAEQIVTEIRNSTSWRLMGPVRRVVSVLRR